MVRHGKTRFQDSWLEDPEVNSWVRKVPGDIYIASCKLCPGQSISIHTMGRQALLSHMRSRKHAIRVKSKQSQPNLCNFIRPNSSSTAATSNSTVCQSASPKSVVKQTSDVEPSITVVDTEEKIQNKSTETFSRPAMDKFLLNSNVSRAEIIWCLHSVNSYKSNRAAAKDIQILKHMFPENETLIKMQLERTKIGYLVVFGLAPYFKDQLLSDVRKCNDIVISFDESLNKISQSQQMDLVIRFWNVEKNQVETRYLTSAFLKRATAVDLLNAFLAAVNGLEISSLVQISMDGPNVNKKFLTDLKDYLSDDLKLENKLIDLGTCGLHTMHCAFKAAIAVTSWNIIPYLRATYNFFKDHPARRGKYTQLTGSAMFPKKFCAIRWLENEDVAQNAIDMIPYLKTFVTSLQTEKSVPKTKSFEIIEELLKDPLLGAKLAFFKTISGDLQGFLEEFQSNAPLAPFLYSSLKNVILKEMERFVHTDKISLSMKVLKSSENLLPAAKVNIGIATKCEIGKCKDKITALQVNLFKNDCRSALKCLVERLLEKSPLSYEATKLISCLDPATSYTNCGQDRFEKLMILLVRNSVVNSQTAEKAQAEFKMVCAHSLEKIKNFKRVNKDEGSQMKIINRLDNFWISLLRENDLDQGSLKVVLRKILILSHGNAQVERGFSVNKECIVENMKEESLVAIRTVIDAVRYCGSVEEVPISKSLIQFSRNARAKYQEALDNQRKVNEEDATKRDNKRRNQQLLRELEEKRQKLVNEARKEAELIDKQISKLINQ